MTKKPKSISADTTNSQVAEKPRHGTRDRRPTRKVQLIGLLNRKAGADVTTISKTFGWQPHTEQHVVVNGFSDLVIEVFGQDIGRHARSAIGVSGLPLGLAMEIEGEVLIAPLNS